MDVNNLQKANSRQTKAHNNLLVLKTLYHNDRNSRADLARMTGLTRTTVSAVVESLMTAGLVAEVGMGPSMGGKPPILLSVVDDSRNLIGIDLAENEFRGALVNLRGQIRHRLALPVCGRDGDSALSLAYELIGRLLKEAGSSVAGIGIGAPGLIDSGHGIVRHAVNLHWIDLPLADLLQKQFQKPVCIVNDSQAAAMAEYTFEGNKEHQNLVVLKIGRGTGAGVVLNGRLFFGDAFGAGEFGHVVVSEQGELCRCGHRGCLETFTSSQAIARRVLEISGRQITAGPVTDEQLIEHLVERARGGDAVVCQAVAEAGRYLGVAVAQLVGMLNVQHIVVAGLISQFGTVLLEPVRREVTNRCLCMLAEKTVVEASRLGMDIVILGAAALLLQQEMGLP